MTLHRIIPYLIAVFESMISINQGRMETSANDGPDIAFCYLPTAFGIESEGAILEIRL